MNILFCTYSMPLKWWDVTGIAHNKIWSWIVMELAERGGFSMRVLHNMDPVTVARAGKYGVSCVPVPDKTNYDAVVVFCGPHMPILEGGLTHQTLEAVKRHEGRVVFVTCDYLLQFTASARRYGRVTSGWSEDALVKNKDYRYVLHGSVNHHFKTEKQMEKLWAFPGWQHFIEVPLNMCGIPPDHEKYTMMVDPEVDLLYCGAYRAGRVKWYEKYFCQPEAEKWLVSTGRAADFRGMRGFAAKTMDAVAGKIWKMINKSCVQIVAGDAVDAGCPGTPLPTRYWEAVAAKTPVYFDRDFSYGWAQGPFVNSAAALAVRIASLRANKRRRAKMVESQSEALRDFRPYDAWKIEDWFK